MNHPLTPLEEHDVCRVKDCYSPGEVPHSGPEYLAAHTFEKQFEIERGIEPCWTWLNHPSTFTRGQIWPYRVEFSSPDDEVPPGFHEGVLNWHLGPFLNCAGVITEIRPMSYRDLKYFYGSFVVSPRLIRPRRLQFWTDEIEAGRTNIRLQVDSWIRSPLRGTWDWMQKRFWNRFPKWMQKAIPE